MSEPRLRTRLWVQATLRTLGTLGITATVARRGDDDAGQVLIKQNFLDGTFRVLTRIVLESGMRGWHGGTGAAPVTETGADAYITREIGRDYDLWVIEIEDRDGRLPFTDPVID